MGKFLDGLNKLPDMDRNEIEQDMTMDELEEIVKNSATNKSPGLDGLS